MTEVQPGLRVLRVELGDQRQQGRKGKRGVEGDRQLSLPARAQLRLKAVAPSPASAARYQ